jgi:hypothetical protein
MITIEEGKEFLRQKGEEGVDCPCCGRFYMEYHRPMHRAMAICLVNLFKLNKAKPDYYHITEIFKGHPGDFSKLAYWGLIEEKPKNPNMKSKRTSGFWRITPEGEEFVLSKLKVPRKIILRTNQLVGLEGEEVNIRQVLGDEFNYEEVLQGYLERTLF